MALPVGEEPDIGEPVGPGGGGGGGSGGGGAIVGTAIHDVTFTKQDAGSTLKVLVFANVSSGDDLKGMGYIAIDGIIVSVCPLNLSLVDKSSRGECPITFFAYAEGLAAGDRRVVFSFLNNRERDSSITIRRGATIEITELKSAAL